MEEAGDLIQPLEAGLIVEGHILGEVGDVMAGRVEGRLANSDFTLFKSVGCAAEDCLAAEEVLARAKASQIGEEMNLT